MESICWLIAPFVISLVSYIVARIFDWLLDHHNQDD